MQSEKTIEAEALAKYAGVREFDWAAKLIDPKAHEAYEKGDGFDRLQHINRVVRSRMIAESIIQKALSNPSPTSADAVVEAATAVLKDWDERMPDGPEARKTLSDSDHKYWSPSASMVSSEVMANLRAALKGTFPAAPEAKSEADEDEITTLRKELAEARAALEPFADVADFMDSETEGFSMDDELWLGIINDEFPPYHIKSFALQLFCAARAATDGETKG